MEDTNHQQPHENGTPSKTPIMGGCKDDGYFQERVSTLANVALREHRNHGDSWFPLSVYHVILTPGPTQQTVSHHWHEEAELVYVTNGSVEVQVNSQFFTVHTGQGILIRPEEIHSLAAPEGATESECFAVVFNLRLLHSEQCDRIQHLYINTFTENTTKMPTLIAGESTWERQLLGRIEDIIELNTQQLNGYELGIKGNLFMILFYLNANQPTSRITHLQSDEQMSTKFKKVITYIAAHYADKIRLKDLAEVTNLSEGHFCRYFKQMTNKKPMQYINEYRVNCAANLLSSTDRSIMDIALDVGFDNLSYFIKVFRSLKQCTPTEYRHLLRQAKPEPDRVATIR